MSKTDSIFLDLALTSRCPLRCRYCSVEKKPYPELSAGEWTGIVESFCRLRPVELISLEGGEPFLRADLPRILEACLGMARGVKVVTGGTAPLASLPEEILRHPGFLLELSMDGPREVHNFLRDGSWERAREFLQAALDLGLAVRIRTVVSRHNLPFLEKWLADLDRELAAWAGQVGFRFDTLLFPDALAEEGGTLPRAELNRYPAPALLPSPVEMWGLFWRLKSHPFGSIRMEQDEPLRGCGFAAGGVVSLDPAGVFSFCCEASRGLGRIQNVSADRVLSLLEASARGRPCRACRYFLGGLCRGCSTGQKCGMVNYWGAEDCRALHRWMAQGRDAPASIPPGPDRFHLRP